MIGGDRIGDVIGWRDVPLRGDVVEPWKPEPLDHTQWPPNYKAVYAWRIKTLKKLKSSPTALKSAKAYYSTRPKEFIMHWLDTYDPRRKGALKWVPFVFFARQADMIDFFEDISAAQESGLIEKCRDAGATWLACGYSVHSWLFLKDDAIGWGSRKEMLVDKLGDPDSIFEKIRLMIRRLPKVFRPSGLKEKEHLTFCKCLNPENGSVIAGEAGDNIGRGGRKRIYFKDESAHYERPEKVESALGDNTNVQVDISSVNGIGNPFHRRREAGIEWERGKEIPAGFVRVFIMDWSHHPEKTQEWYDTRKAKHEREGMQHLFAQEVERNYSAAVSNLVIPAEYVKAAVDAHLKIPMLQKAYMTAPKNAVAGLDVADEGLDRNALTIRQWIVCTSVTEWGERDPAATARRAIDECNKYKNFSLMYDSIGIGASVKGEYNNIKELPHYKINGTLTAWAASAGVREPFATVVPEDDESPINKDFFENLKAQAWWSVYRRFYKTWRVVEAIKNNQPVPDYKPDELISIDGSIPLLQTLIKELSQATRVQSSHMRLMIDKAPKGTKSPNLADSFVMSYFPIIENNFALVGSL